MASPATSPAPMSNRLDQSGGGPRLVVLLSLVQERESLTISMGGSDRVKHLEDDSREVALEAAKCLAATLALGLLASQEHPRRDVHLALGDRDPVQGAVELTVALAVQAVAA